MTKRRNSRPSTKSPATKRRERRIGTRIKGLYYPTGVAPDEFFRELGRLRKEAEAEIERLISFIDSLDDPDLEPDADFEPTLGSALFLNGGDQEDWATPDVEEREPDPDYEPSLGWTRDGYHGGNDDLEDEFDGAEPDEENEPTLGASEVLGNGASFHFLDQEVSWAPSTSLSFEPEADSLDIAGELDDAEHDSNAVMIVDDGGPCAHANAEAMAAQMLSEKRRKLRARKEKTEPPPARPNASQGIRMLVVRPEFFQ